MHSLALKRTFKQFRRFLRCSSLLLLPVALFSSVLVAPSALFVPSAQARKFRSQALFETLTLDPSFAVDPQVIHGISGGLYPANLVAEREETITGPCAGFLDREPDHIIQLTSYFHYLRIQVESPEDTTMVIRGPGGTWCNDDYEGKNPGIAGQWLSGTYGIWIGSYIESEYHPYVIRVTEVR